MERRDFESLSEPFTPAKADALKRRAELRALREGPPWHPHPGRLPLDEVRRVIHRLRTHQIELEIRNEELSRAQAALEAARDHYRDLHERAPVAYLTIGERDMILEANLAAAGLLGAEREALVGRTVRRFVDRSSRGAWDEARRCLVGGDASQHVELTMLRADGSRLSGFVEMALARDARGNPVARVVITRHHGANAGRAAAAPSESSMAAGEVVREADPDGQSPRPPLQQPPGRHRGERGRGRGRPSARLPGHRGPG